MTYEQSLKVKGMEKITWDSAQSEERGKTYSRKSQQLYEKNRKKNSLGKELLARKKEHEDIEVLRKSTVKSQ